MVDNGSLGVNVIQDYVGIATVAGSEHDHLKLFRKIRQNFFRILSNVDSSLDNIPIREDYGEFDVRLFIDFNTMNQRLIQIEYKGFSAWGLKVVRQLYFEILDFRIAGFVYLLHVVEYFQ